MNEIIQSKVIHTDESYTTKMQEPVIRRLVCSMRVADLLRNMHYLLKNFRANNGILITLFGNGVADSLHFLVLSGKLMSTF